MGKINNLVGLNIKNEKKHIVKSNMTEEAAINTLFFNFEHFGSDS